MTAIDRTIYHRMKRNYTPKELIEACTPTEEGRHFVNTMTRTAQNQLNLMRRRSRKDFLQSTLGTERASEKLAV
jgi:hypothetical protein